MQCAPECTPRPGSTYKSSPAVAVQQTTAVLAGDIEIGKSSLISLMNAHLRGIPLSVIGGSNIYDPSHPYAQIVITADSPFTSAKDLNGKTIGVPSLNDLNVLACDLWLDKYGGDSKSVKYVELPNPSLTAALTGHLEYSNATSLRQANNS